MNKVVLALVSGGADSAYNVLKAKEEGYYVIGLFVDYGQKALRAEREVVNEWQDIGLIDELHRVFGVKMLEDGGGLTNEDAFVPFRNVKLLIEAGEFLYKSKTKVDKILFGYSSKYDEGVFIDNSRDFHSIMSKMISEIIGYEVKIESYAEDKNKYEVVKELIDKGIRYSSCWNGNNCGKCLQCKIDKSIKDFNVVRKGFGKYGEGLMEMNDEYRKKYPQRAERLWNDEGKADVVVIDDPLYLEWYRNKSGKKKDEVIVFDFVDYYDEIALKEGDKEKAKKIKDIILNLPYIVDGIILEGESLRVRYGSTGEDIIVPNGYEYEGGLVDIEKDREKRIAVYVGKLDTWHSGILDIVDAIADSEKWKLLVLGTGELEEDICDRKNVECVGYQDNVYEWLKKADAGVFDCNDDSPIAVSEYVGVGLSLILKGDRMKWLFKENENAVYVNDWSDIEAVDYDILRKLNMNNRKLREELKWRNLRRKAWSFCYKIWYDRRFR